MSFKKKRGILRCAIVGDLRQPSRYKLYRYIDIIWFFLYHKALLLKDNTKYTIKASKIAELVKSDVLKLWNVSKLPILTANRIKNKIEAFYDKYRKLLGKKQKGQLSESAAKAFIDESKSTFSICSCKCKCTSVCACSCGMTAEQCEFWRDQQTDRLSSLNCNIETLTRFYTFNNMKCISQMMLMMKTI